jgi:hypothetical protein
MVAMQIRDRREARTDLLLCPTVTMVPMRLPLCVSCTMAVSNLTRVPYR